MTRAYVTRVELVFCNHLETCWPFSRLMITCFSHSDECHGTASVFDFSRGTTVLISLRLWIPILIGVVSTLHLHYEPSENDPMPHSFAAAVPCRCVDSNRCIVDTLFQVPYSNSFNSLGSPWKKPHLWTSGSMVSERSFIWSRSSKNSASLRFSL